MKHDNNTASHVEAADTDLKGDSQWVEGIAEQENVVADLSESSVPMKQELWKYRKVIGCLFIIYLNMLNVGLDNVIGGLAIGMPAFRKYYGYYYKGSYVVDSTYQSAWSGASVGAQCIGNFLSGWIADKYGHRTSMFISVIISIIATSIMVASTSVQMLVAGKTVVGLGVGFVVAQAAPYAKELSPDRLTGLATIGVGTALHIGQWAGSGITWICVGAFPDIDDHRSFRLLFGLQYVFAGFFLIFVYFLPESPYYYIRNDNVEKAHEVFRYLYGDKVDVGKKTIYIQYEIERARNLAQSSSFITPWLGTNRRRTLIGVLVMTGQLFSGNLFFPSYQTYFYELANVKASNAVTFANYCISLLGNFLAYFVIDSIGRRTLYISCMMVSAICNLLTGAMANVQKFNPTAAADVAITCIAVWKFAYMLGLSPGAYSILGEVPTSRLKAKTNAWINIVNSLVSFGISYAIPPLFNPDKCNLGMRMGYIFFVSSLIYWVIAFFYLPETCLRTGLELDELFENRVATRKFPKAQFDGNDRLILESVGKSSSARQEDVDLEAEAEARD